MKVAVKPDFQRQAWRVRRAAFSARREGEPQGGQIQLIDKLAQKAGRVIAGHQVFQGRRKKELLSVIGSDRLSPRSLDAQSNKLFNKTQ